VPDTLVIGVGNALLSDEGVGVHVARRLQSMPLPPDVEVIDGGTEGYELIRFLRGRTRVVIVDCLLADEPPGTLIRATPDELDLQWTPCYSTHQSGLREFLQGVRSLPSTPAIVIMGIVPAEAGVIGTTLSTAVASGLERITAAVLDEASTPDPLKRGNQDPAMSEPGM
jgi:hydrogenase maturation protease